MINDAFNGFLRRRGHILRQVARLLKSRYRMNILINNFNRISDIREEFEVLKRLD